VATIAIMRTSLETCVQDILKDREFPAFSNRLQLLMSIEQEDQSAQKLADLVLQDFGLTLKVLQVANSFQYNRSNKTIDSVSRAIMVMGVRTVQGLAGGLAFFDHYQKRSPVLKRLMLLSMLTAHHAAAAAEAIGFREREEAHIAGMFRNLGEVLVCCHCPAPYARISVETRGGAQAPHQACIRTLGFTYDALARAIGREWRMPSNIAAVWAPAETGSTENTLGQLVQFAHDLTTVMYRRAAGDLDARLQLLAMQHGHRLRLNEEGISAIADRAIGETQDIFASLNATIDSVRNGPAPRASATT
jgi:HD-like signal output (HDOD) protein